MANTATDKSVKFLAKLLELTQEKKLVWKAESSPRGTTAFECRLENGTRSLRLYRYIEDVEVYDPQPYSRIQDMLTPKAPRIRKVEKTVLEVLDGSLVTFTFEGMSGLRDLYDSVSFSASKVDELMDSVLKAAAS